MPALLIVLAIVIGIQSGLTVAQDEEPIDLSKYDAFLEPHVSESKPCSTATNRDRFQLCNACRPMELVVKDLSADAASIGLTMETLQAAAESRLRAARLYTEDLAKANGAHLYVNVAVTRTAFSLLMEYRKHLHDPVSDEIAIAVTWREGSTGGHGRDSGFLVQSLSEKLDKFLVEYLRVNEEDCPR